MTEIFTLAALVAFGAYVLRAGYQRKRIALLGSYLGKYQIEKLMESLTEGYLRALGENKADRQEQIWHLLEATEAKLCGQFNSFVAEFSKVDEADTRVSKLALALPYADRLFPDATFDLRKLLAVHAQAIGNAAANSAGRTPKGKAFTLSAELLLMQHSCHWFCKSKAVASARVLVRHQTPYAQLLASVAPETARAYGALVGA